MSLNQEEAGLNVEGSWPVSVVPFFDRDGDGVHDDFDGCPETPASAPVNSTGCEGDDDADGVANSDDACPNTPGDVTVDAVGCEQEKEVEVETIEVFTLDGYVAHGSDVSLVAFHPEVTNLQPFMPDSVRPQPATLNPLPQAPSEFGTQAAEH